MKLMVGSSYVEPASKVTMEGFWVSPSGRELTWAIADGCLVTHDADGNFKAMIPLEALDAVLQLLGRR